MQAQILNLMLDLQDRLGLTYLFVAHDLSVVKHVSDRVAVMYVGRIVEIAGTQALYQSPKHPYTEALLSAVPVPDPKTQKARKRLVYRGEIPDVSHWPSGCHLHGRCPLATEKCSLEAPPLREIEENRWVSCHRAAELSLNGVR